MFCKINIRLFFLLMAGSFIIIHAIIPHYHHLPFEHFQHLCEHEDQDTKNVNDLELALCRSEGHHECHHCNFTVEYVKSASTFSISLFLDQIEDIKYLTDYAEILSKKTIAHIFNQIKPSLSLRGPPTIS